MLIDTHAHVNFKAFEQDGEEVIKRALEQGVWIVNVGTQIDTSRQAVELAEKFNHPSLNPSPSEGREGAGGGVYAVIGLHPVHTYSQHVDEEENSFQTRKENFDYDAYHQLAQNSKVVGIGECGLDYFRLPAETQHGTWNMEQIKQQQKEVFIAQIKLAKEVNKALVIHCRPSVGSQDAYEDILQILDREFENFQFPISNFQFEIHSFTGTPEIAQEFLKRGAYVGLNGIITFDKTGNMQKVVETVPLERIVLETDSPYLTPAPHRGKRNEPLYVKHVAEKIAGIKQVSLEEVGNQTTLSAKKLFNI
ncbi:MAG: TatD family hydrolase [Patescibacteria group bacterium]